MTNQSAGLQTPFPPRFNLNADYLTVPEDRIPTIEWLLTMVGGRMVYVAGLLPGLQGLSFCAKLKSKTRSGGTG
jgi:hypothetical protein